MRKSNSTITVCRMMILVFGFVLGCVCASWAFGESASIEVTQLPGSRMTLKSVEIVDCNDCVVCKPRLVRYAPLRMVPRTAMIVEYRNPAYTIVAEPREPVVIRGLFTDRVRVPRGQVLTVEKQ